MHTSLIKKSLQKEGIVCIVPHPNGSVQGGTAIIVQQNIFHFNQAKIGESYWQATIIMIQYNGADLVRYTIRQVTALLNNMKTSTVWVTRFIIRGHFNMEHTAFGSRLITSRKGKILLDAANESKYQFHSSQTPSHWPADNNKVLDFFITKGIIYNWLNIKGIKDLTYFHMPVFLSLSAAVIKKRKPNLTNENTD